MKTFALAMATALALGVGAASAQTTVIERDSTGAITTLSPEQRTVIRRTIVKERRVAPKAEVEIRVGESVPDAVELYELPQTVVTEVPSYRSYKYFQAGDQVVIVDEDDNRIVEVID